MSLVCCFKIYLSQVITVPLCRDYLRKVDIKTITSFLFKPTVEEMKRGEIKVTVHSEWVTLRRRVCYCRLFVILKEMHQFQLGLSCLNLSYLPEIYLLIHLTLK